MRTNEELAAAAYRTRLEEVGAKIRAGRENLGMTQAEAGDRSGIGKNKVTRIENANTEYGFTQGEIDALARAVKVNVGGVRISEEMLTHIATGLRVIDLRRSENLRQKDLADVLGIDYRRLGHIERGERYLRPEEVTDLANVFAVPREQIIVNVASPLRTEPRLYQTNRIAEPAPVGVEDHEADTTEWVRGLSDEARAWLGGHPNWMPDHVRNELGVDIDPEAEWPRAPREAAPSDAVIVAPTGTTEIVIRIQFRADGGIEVQP